MLLEAGGMGIYSDFTTFFTLIYLNSFCQKPARYTSTASDISNLPITPGLLYIFCVFVRYCVVKRGGNMEMSAGGKSCVFCHVHPTNSTCIHPAKSINVKFSSFKSLLNVV